MSGYSPASPLIVRSWPPTAWSRATTSSSCPAQAIWAPTCSARSTRTSTTSGSCSALMVMAPALMIPDFSEAMSSRVSPRNFWWSMPIGVMTLT